MKPEKLLLPFFILLIVLTAVYITAPEVSAHTDTIDITQPSVQLINDTVNETTIQSVQEKAEKGIVDFFGLEIQLPEPLNNHFGVFLVFILVWTLVGAIIYFLLDPIVKFFVKKTKTKIDDMILDIMKKPIFYIVVLYGIIRSLEVLPIPTGLALYIMKIYYFFLIILLGYLSIKIFTDVIMELAEQLAAKTESKMDDVLLPLLEKIGKTVIIITIILFLMDFMGIDVTVLVAGMGIAGLVIAFAAQDTLSNFFAGIFLLTDRPFDIGDVIKLEDGTYCQIQKVGMRSTRLYDTFNHQRIIVPNTTIANEKVINVSKPDPRIKISFTVGVAYGTNIKKAKKVIMEEIKKTKHIIIEKDRRPSIKFTNFGDSALDIFVKVWVDHFNNQWDAADELKTRIYYRFAKEGIEIPFPQHVVWLAGEDKESG